MSIGIGDRLREAREAQGRTIEDLARAVRARAEQLHALEEERFEFFPGEVYAKGFLRSYAAELGLDPAPLLDQYRAEHADTDGLHAPGLVSGVTPKVGPRRSTPPAWLTWLLIGGLVIAGIAFLGAISTRFSPETADPDEPAGPPAAPAPQEGEAPPEPEPVEEPEPEPVFEGVDVVIALEEASWLRITVDGTVVLEQIVDAGETLQYQGDDEVIVRAGNAGGVRIEVNGEDQGAPGARGQVAEMTYTVDDTGGGAAAGGGTPDAA